MDVETLTTDAAQHRTRWTVADVDLLPDNATRYEIVDGELFMSKQPHWNHLKQVEVYRRDHGALKLASTLFETDELASPVLPGFTCRIA